MDRGIRIMLLFFRTLKARLAIALLIFLPLGALATDGNPTLSLRGFGTFAASGTDTNQIAFRRDSTQANGVTRSWGIKPDSRLGLQLDVNFDATWHAAVQWVARDHAGDFLEQNLDWAFLRWRPRDDLDLRIGRLGFDVFMLSDYRNVGYAYPWIRPPHEFYAGLLPYHFDGADISQKLTLGNGLLTLKGFGGYASYSVPGLPNVADLGSLVAGGSLAYERGNWRARLGYGYAKTKTELPLQKTLYDALGNPQVNALWPGASALAREIRILDTAVQFSSVGLAYDDGTWLAQIEGSYIDSQVRSYPSVISGYLSLGRRLGKVTLYSLLGMSRSLQSTRAIPPLLVATPELQELRSSVGYLLNHNEVDEQSVSVGVRWDLYDNIALKAQWDHFWLGQNGTQLWVEPSLLSDPTPSTVNVWSLGVDFVF